MAGLQGANFPGADSRCLINGTSSRAAWFIVYKSDDDPGDPYLRINVPTQAIGVEPIDIMQDLYDDFLSINDYDLKNKIKLYPNPALDELIVSINSTLSLVRMEVIDLGGKRIAQFNEFSSNTQQHKINVSSFESGIYFIKIESLQGSITLKFVKL